MRLSFSSLAYAFVLTCCVVTSARALESAPARGEFSTIRFLAGKLEAPEAPAAGEAPVAATLEGGIELKLEGEWKTYWRSPGDAGFPMTVAPGPLAQNIAAVEVHWPFPTRFVEEWGLEVFGFKHEVLVPVTLTLADPAAPTQVDLRVSYAVCSDICINEEHHVSLAVPVDYRAGAKALQRIAAARAKVPQANGTDGLAIGEAAIASEDAAGNKGVLTVAATTQEGKFAKPDLFVEGPAGVRFPLPDVQVTGQGKRAEFRIPYELSLPAKTLDGAELTLTLVNGQKAVEAKLPVKKQQIEQSAGAGEKSPADDRPQGWWKRFAAAGWLPFNIR